MARQCIFCPNKANSKEHLWPDWILRRLKISRPMLHVRAASPAKIIPRAEILIKCVCETCNHGWMHDLEDLNIPIIGSMMEDNSMHLTLEHQRAVVRWAIKTSMVQDAIDTRNRKLFYTGPERFALRSNTSLPNYTSVWLGRSSPQNACVRRV
jgi:hypothetical protein